MDRRQFNHLCGSLIAGAASLDAAASSQLPASDQTWPTTLLTDAAGEPLQFDSLSAGSSLVFHYPYKTTPCLLIRLNAEPTGGASLTDRFGNQYTWQGGVGSDRSLVAFSAICTHKMSHPAKPISHLNFRHDAKQITNRDGTRQTRAQLITCCSEYSIYDATKGAEVINGPATQPLTAILLSVNTDGHILATGTRGGHIYEEFLQKFGLRQSMEQGLSKPDVLSASETVAVPADSYSRQQILC